MAIKLKAGKTFSDSFSKTPATSHFGYVDNISIDKVNKTASIVLSIFNEQMTSAERKTIAPVKVDVLQVIGSLFDLYFDIAILTVNDQYKKAYQYILAEVIDPVSFSYSTDVDGITTQTKNPDVMTYADWESDEVV